ncbi:MAG: 3-dehydroquinate synthase, partial [Acidobacteria bacterium]|nr:3-dehydroquinate synthase [Acidobacteriota bacterium]
MEPTRLEVSAAAGSYAVVIGPGTLATLPALLDQSALGPRRVIVSSPLVWKLHHDALDDVATEPDPILVPDGERFKNLATVGRVYEALIEMRADRSTVVVAVGGGVIGDMVGFAAATYLRGVRLVHVPTTVMAQVDSAVGGKVGVNHALGKNLIGAFHAPKLVVADPAVLATLPRREFRAGLYEVIKYGVIASPALFDRVEGTLAALFARDAGVITAVVSESCRIKAGVVSADERESGPRRVLNFGHTVGHALEAVTKYRRFRHGEAV